MQTFLLAENEEIFLEGVTVSQLTGQHLVDILVEKENGVRIRRNRDHWIGRLVLDKYSLVIPPDFDSGLFLDLLLASEGQLPIGKSDLYGTSSISIPDGADSFIKLLATSLVSQVKFNLAHNVSKQYVETVNREKCIRGRPLWTKNFGAHPASGITCRTHRLSHDNELNKVILGGLELASRILRNTPMSSLCNELLFEWRSFINPVPLSIELIDSAIAKVTKLTQHYSTALHLSRALIANSSQNIFEQGSSKVPTMEFYLPEIFERFVFRLIKSFLSNTSLSVTEQSIDSSALLDGNNNNYRRILPDILIEDGGKTLAVIDSKFKKRYVEGLPGHIVPKRNRVTNADIYQLFFYQSRLRTLNKDQTYPKAAIIAPQFTKSNEIWDVEKRKIYWHTEANIVLNVIPLPLAPILQAIADHSIEESISHAPELREFLKNLCHEKFPLVIAS